MPQNSGVVGTEEAQEWPFTGALESRDDEAIGVMLYPWTVELDAAGDGGCGGVEGLLPGWLAPQDPRLTTVLQHMPTWDGGASLRHCWHGSCRDSCPPW